MVPSSGNKLSLHRPIYIAISLYRPANVYIYICMKTSQQLHLWGQFFFFFFFFLRGFHFSLFSSLQVFYKRKSVLFTSSAPMALQLGVKGNESPQKKLHLLSHCLFAKQEENIIVSIYLVTWVLNPTLHIHLYSYKEIRMA